MKRKLMEDALEYIDESYLADAIAPKKNRLRLPWVGAVAAVLAAAITVGLFLRPAAVPVQAHGLFAAPSYPQMAPYPTDYDGDRYSQWRQSERAQHNQPLNYQAGTEDFFNRSITQFLSGNNEKNIAYSPLNVYMALAMLAQTADGESRQQLLSLLGSNSMEALRTQAGHMWNAHYWNDGLSTSVLASSLWLQDGYTFNEETVGHLTDSFYASVYQGELGSNKMNASLQAWLNENTGNLLTEYTKDIRLSPQTILALATTIYYNVQWTDDFRADANTKDIFHSPAGDRTVTYMNTGYNMRSYYWGKDFSAIRLGLQDGSHMWLILPDDGLTVSDILVSGNALGMIQGNADCYNEKDLRVRLSLPKFDITSNTDLIPGLQALGITDVFDRERADFSSLAEQTDDIYVNQAQHAVRVAIDEKGLLAAAYTILGLAGSAAPTDEEIDFVLDRPFLFLVESSDGLPLFTGVVNQP